MCMIDPSSAAGPPRLNGRPLHLRDFELSFAELCWLLKVQLFVLDHFSTTPSIGSDVAGG